MKPDGSESVAAPSSLRLIVTATFTATDWPTPTLTPAAAAGGTMTRMRVGVTESTCAAAPLNVTRTGWSKPPPKIETSSPPWGEPSAGVTDEMKKVPAWPIETLAAPALGPTTARTVAVPTAPPAKSTVCALPLTSWSVTSCVPLPKAPKLPMFVVTTTSVRSGGGWPLSVRRTSTVMVLPVPAPAVSCPGLGVTVMA